MNKNSKNIVFILFFLISFFSRAQFNTLLPTIPKKSEKIQVTSKLEEESKKEKEKRNWKNLFKITTKSDLKKEIDSLKKMLKDYNEVSSLRKNDFQKLRDSLILMSQKNNAEKKQNLNSKSKFNVYDFVDEPKENYSKIMMPLRNKITITSSYGTRTHPIFGVKKMHNGIDIKANYENVYAVMDGIVTASGWDTKGGGNFIKVKHFNRFETSYLHLSERYYKEGDRVKAGYIIGKSGNTGNSTAPHLHFSVKEYGQSINPSVFLNDLIKVNNLIALYNE